jgi:hypothetical protein
MDQCGDPEATGTDRARLPPWSGLARAGFVDGDQARLVDLGLRSDWLGFVRRRRCI